MRSRYRTRASKRTSLPSTTSNNSLDREDVLELLLSVVPMQVPHPLRQHGWSCNFSIESSSRSFHEVPASLFRQPYKGVSTDTNRTVRHNVLLLRGCFLLASATPPAWTSCMALVEAHLVIGPSTMVNFRPVVKKAWHNPITIFLPLGVTKTTPNLPTKACALTYMFKLADLAT